MLHPHTVVRSVNDAIGVGVFATRRIPRGTLTWVLDPLDVVLPDAAVQELDPLRRAVFDRYAWVEQGRWILCWDHGRYVNHACDANCIGLGVQFEIALRDIEEGEQLTDDYRSLGQFEHAFDCLCGTPGCTGRVEPSDVLRLRPMWQDRFHAALPLMGAVHQPLLPWVSGADLLKTPLGRQAS